MLIKIWAKLNKIHEYKDQIEYKILTLTRDTRLDWHMDI